MNSRLTSIIKWGCVVYSIIFLPRIFISFSSEPEVAAHKPLRVGIACESGTFPTTRQSLLVELDKQGYMVNKLLVLDRVSEYEHGDSRQLEQLLADADLDEIDVLLCQDGQVPTFKQRKNL